MLTKEGMYLKNEIGSMSQPAPKQRHQPTTPESKTFFKKQTGWASKLQGQHCRTAGTGSRLLSGIPTYRKQSVELANVISNGIKWNHRASVQLKKLLTDGQRVYRMREILYNHTPHRKLSSRLYKGHRVSYIPCPPYHPVFPIQFYQILSEGREQDES